MFNFHPGKPTTADKDTLLGEITTAAQKQVDNGNISLDELKKIVALLNNTARLKYALRFL